MLLSLLLLTARTTVRADQSLVDLSAGYDLSRPVRTDAETRLVPHGGGHALQIQTGTAQAWPGITLLAPEGHWDLADFGQVELEVRNTGVKPVVVNCRVDNPGADGTHHCVTGRLDLEPGANGTLRVPLKRAGGDTLGGELFGMRGYPVAAGGDHTVDPGNITQLVIFVNKPKVPHAFEVRDIRASGSWTRPTAWTSDASPYVPFIDTFGQYRHRDWPGKVHSLDELRSNRDREAAHLAENPGPTGCNQYGGWADGPQLEATGFFRVQKYQDKWWLVDPEGRLFWSHGIDCVRFLDATVVEDREHWFDEFPAGQAEYEQFAMVSGHVLKGHYAGRRARSFCFAGTNLKRKYGEDWRRVVPSVIHQRLRSWGLNTIGNWSDDDVRMLRRTPYTDSISSRGTPDIEGSEGYWGKFPDVFDPRFEQELRHSMAARREQSANDPWCLGYFSDNEMSWGDDLSLSVATLRSPAEQAAKRELLADLRAKYVDIAALNSAWGTNHASWDDLAASRDTPDLEQARPDLEAFYTRTADRYFETVRRVIGEVAPHQLYLGCRFAWVNARAAAAAARHCDIVSYNRYRRSVADFEFNGGVDVPLIIGEFHFGALDRGLFHTGLVPVENQAARAQAYQEYVESALQHPQFVGCHWFQYQDQPTTGRVHDEENYQIGFIDIADTPYPETIAASRRVGERLYGTRLGIAETGPQAALLPATCAEFGDLGDGTYRNPVLVGSQGDVSVIRVGADYYATFGKTLKVWHSRDLVNWSHIGQADTHGLGSPWAPDIVQHDGVFFIYTTLVNRSRPSGLQFRNVVYTAADPSGPWSAPINLDLYGMIDPGHLTATNGDRYLYYNKGRFVVLNEAGTKVNGDVRQVYNGWEYPADWEVECFCLEAPKLLFRRGWYYMLSAQGGTAGPPTAHMVVVARSRSPVGPWENSPDNPLIRTWSEEEAWHRQGHGQFVEDLQGDWWMLYTGYNRRMAEGKILLLAPVEWTDDAWPRLPEGWKAETITRKPVGEAVRHDGLKADDAQSARGAS